MPASAVPTVLFHYTSQQGLIGILEKKELWATQIQYQNDEVEFSHAWSVLMTVVRSQKEKFPGQQLMAKRLTRDLAHKFHVCVCSFSEVDDQLSQWRGYCRPGSAFSLGFWTKDLQTLADGAKWELAQCIYDVDRQRQLVSDLFDKHSELYSKILERFGGDVPAAREPLTEQLDNFVKEFVLLAPQIKHPSFSEEREWRLISPLIQSGDLEFREGRHTPIPYFRLHYYNEGPCPIQSITVGPGSHIELSIDAVHSLLFKIGWLACEVRPTQGTLRDWG